MRRIAVVVVIIGMTWTLAGDAHPASTSPGRNSVFGSGTGTLNVDGEIAPLAGTIQKGKSKKVLRLTASLGINGSPTLNGVFLRAFVNGVAFEPAVFYQQQCNPSNGNACTVSGTFWLDLDAAEVASPGVFLGKPLNLTIEGGNPDSVGEGVLYKASFAADLVKK